MGSTSFSEVIFSIESVKNPLAESIYTAMKRKSTLQKLYHDVGASFIPTVPPSVIRLRLGKWLRNHLTGPMYTVNERKSTFPKFPLECEWGIHQRPNPLQLRGMGVQTG